MSRILDVYLRTTLTGHLIQNDYGEMIFTYAESWLNNTSAIPLSQSLPLRKASFLRRECRGFFGGILPEENKRDLIARNLGISTRNDFAMLEQIGGECAGAVTFLPGGESFPQQNYGYRELSTSELVSVLKELPRRPLLAGDVGIRLSLAGAQDKVAVHLSDGKISIPLGGAPSTHILKPANEHFAGLVFNEAFCMKLADEIGLPVAETEIGDAGGIDYLLVKRYDRVTGPNNTERLHQEDFCQAFGIVSEMKYQAEGGPSLKHCFDLLRDVSDVPVKDLQSLLDGVIFNYLIGNHDAHGKNFSLLYSGDVILGRSTNLAPFYDLLSTVYYPDLTKNMAMKIGGEYQSAQIMPQHFEHMAEDLGLSKPSVRRRVPDLAQTILENINNIKIKHEVVTSLAHIISQRCEKTIGDYGRR